MNDFQAYIEKYLAKQQNVQSVNVNIRYHLRDFLQSKRDFQVLFLVHHLIVEARYKEKEKIVDFLLFVYPDVKNDEKRLWKIVELSLEWF